MPKPNRSFIWVENIVMAIPPVKPMIIGYGMNLITLPRRNTPISTSMIPAITVAIARPPTPYCWMIP